MQRNVYEFISQQTDDPIVERRTCSIRGIEFAIFQSDIDFLETISPIFNGKKYHLPLPTLCPEERQRQRMLFRNERKLYKRTCDLSSKHIISMYSPEKAYKVYDAKIRWSDQWNPSEYGFKFDFSKSFYQQFDTFLKTVPRESLIMLNTENCEYNNMIRDSKNCYLCALVATGCEHLYYSYWIVNNSTWLVDTMQGFHSESCYQCINIVDCYNDTYIFDSENTTDSLFSYNLKGCRKCIFCSNLTNKEYHIYNKSCSKEEYEQLRNLILSSYTSFENHKKQFISNLKEGIKKQWENIHGEQIIGNYLKESKNCMFCFDGENGENLKYVFNYGNVKNCMDVYACGFQNSEYVYESVVIKGDYKILFSYNITHGENIYYSDSCVNCKNIFGCIGLKNKEYCIFNTQYTKETYEIEVGKIIEHMIKNKERGTFWPATLSPFGYNETVAQDTMSLEKNKAIQRGYKRQDKEYPINISEGMETIKANDLSENIDDINDTILDKAIICDVSGKPFRIIKPELDFYRTHHLPLPRKHPDIRHTERLKQRPGRDLYVRKCNKCNIEILSVFTQEYKGKVYCEACYGQEVY